MVNEMTYFFLWKIGYVRVFLRVEMLSLQGFMMILWYSRRS